MRASCGSSTNLSNRCCQGSPRRPKQPYRRAATAHAAATALTAAVVPGTKVDLVTKSDCELAVSLYPMFAYDASAGTGIGTISKGEGGRMNVVFDADTVTVPSLNWKTTKIFGVPLPPPLNIDIFTSKLEGWIDPETGQAELNFAAEFRFKVAMLYDAPPLRVETSLSTETSEGKFRSGTGQRLVDNVGKLCGIALVPKTGDWLIDAFLMLPTDAYSMLSAEFRPVK